VRAAILIATQHVVTKRKDGSLIRGCGLNTFSFLEGKPTVLLEEFSEKLQLILRDAKVEFEVLTSCNVIIQRLQM
jgi:hypothetical protein